MRVLVTAPYHEKGLEELRSILGDVVYCPWKQQGRAFNEAELLKMLYETEAEALITEHDQVTEQVINGNAHLQFIGVCRGTPSNVAVHTASRYGIPVFYTPARNAQAVAELFIANLITFLRSTVEAMQWLKDRQWDQGAHTSYLAFKGNELAGRRIGMVGFGAIGQLIARLVEQYPCEISYYDPFVDPALFPNYRQQSIEELFASNDIISIHLPVTADTKGMINADLLNRMHADAIFVNTARAVVVNREDLYELLQQKRIRGAILDVFDNEPPDQLDYQIIDLPNVMATPHIAGATHEVEDHHVRILNSVLANWFVNGCQTGDRLANREILSSNISR